MGWRFPSFFESFLLAVLLEGFFLGQAGTGEPHSHKASHGGVLNVIGKELGHVEILIEGNKLEAWFVEGGHHTDRSVPIKASEIYLTVSLPGGRETRLILRAAPTTAYLVLA